MNAKNPYVDSYMAIIPGITLAKIYKKYQQSLLEKNVRTFLQFKGKVNKAIRKTLREEPDLFFAYNNGISTTATEIEIEKRGGVLCITRLYDWQIVNGGQTTAAIAALMYDRMIDMSRVFVPMKVSVIRNMEDSKDIVDAISFSSNSQTAIKNSDFSSNEPYLIDLEKLSRTEWVTDSKGKPISKWYFERTRGQYLDQLAQLNDFNAKSFKRDYPKAQKITKTDIAKYELLWNMQPYNVCRGAEQNYTRFVSEIKKEQPIVTANYYKHIIAKSILYNTIDGLVKRNNKGGYKANMNAYIMASISFLSDKNLNLTYIWEQQNIQQDVIDRIEELIPIIWNHLDVTRGNSLLKIGEWSKRADCWSALKMKLANYEKFGENLRQVETNEDGTFLNDVQQNQIDEAAAIEPTYWFALAEWAKKNDYFTPMDRKAAFNYGTMRSRNRAFKGLKQAQAALKLVEQAKELGFKG